MIVWAEIGEGREAGWEFHWRGEDRDFGGGGVNMVPDQVRCNSVGKDINTSYHSLGF